MPQRRTLSLVLGHAVIISKRANASSYPVSWQALCPTKGALRAPILSEEDARRMRRALAWHLDREGHGLADRDAFLCHLIGA
jgi:hypothetical protein